MSAGCQPNARRLPRTPCVRVCVWYNPRFSRNIWGQTVSTSYSPTSWTVVRVCQKEPNSALQFVRRQHVDSGASRWRSISIWHIPTRSRPGANTLYDQEYRDAGLDHRFAPDTSLRAACSRGTRESLGQEEKGLAGGRASKALILLAGRSLPGPTDEHQHPCAAQRAVCSVQCAVCSVQCAVSLQTTNPPVCFCTSTSTSLV